MSDAPVKLPSVMEGWARYCVQRGVRFNVYVAGYELLSCRDENGYWLQRGFAATLAAVESTIGEPTT